MRILLANTFHYPRGGASIFVLKLSELLRSRGHEVFHYAMQHPSSLPCPETEEYWPSYIDFPEILTKKNPQNVLRVIKRIIRSGEAEVGIRRLLEDKGPFDVAHLHNILHHLTPSILEPLNERNVPVIWTLHDFSLLCPNTNFVNNRIGRLCTKCLKGGIRFVNAPLSRCKKGSFTASLMAAIEAWNHRLRRVSDKIDLFISPSRFLGEKFSEAGFDSAKFKIIPNFVDIPAKNPLPQGNYALYAGRLSQEKGVTSLISAWAKMPPDFYLKIAGTGPIEAQLRFMANGAQNIDFLGFLEPRQLRLIRHNARFTISPSISWDNFPISIQESFADGIPVLGANIGGIPEMVRAGESGLLFEPGNLHDLREKALELWANPDYTRSLGEKARKIAITEYSPEIHANKILAVYANTIAAKN